ncbi:Alpha-amylase type A isozyme [Fusarium austroafricanum]|uniref:Alpha-amylase type A isozyme n=1 Tax=Fusarium austroafricanum TaxID=2364996 RepID=A0A8H4KNM0_9HYPO|nr:Alpha-amylase type A isozyme [Fusarium austroafricanum]
MAAILSQIPAAVNDIENNIKTQSVSASTLTHDERYKSAEAQQEATVGILGETVQHTGISLRPNGSETETHWTQFDTMPAMATGSDTMSLFSYKGAFYVACIAPFDSVSSDGTVEVSVLVRLASDGSLSWARDEVTPGMVFKPLQPISNITSNFVKIAYWNAAIWGYDSSNKICKMVPHLTSGGELDGYSVGEILVSGRPVVDVTAVDTGLKWIDDGSVTHLRAASPGVILDLENLTRFLKHQYISTQTNLFPYTNQIQAFCASQKVYLDNLLQASKDYENAQIVERSKRLPGKRITALNKTLNVLEGQEKLLTEAIWCSVGAMIVGIGVIIISVLVPQAASISGVKVGIGMAIGGIIGLIASVVKRETLRACIAATRSSIESLAESKEQLSIIKNSFIDLTSQYGTLKSFWFSMVSVSMQITVLEDLGEFLLQDPASIEAAWESNQKVIDNLNEYTKVLGSQGISPPASPLIDPPVMASMGPAELAVHVTKREPNVEKHQNLLLELIPQLMSSAANKLAEKDDKSYVSMMRKAMEVKNLI